MDDEPQLLEIFGLWLTAAGCGKLYTAKNGEGALAVLNAHSIDLLVTDVRMPIMDGITLVRRLVGLTKPIPSIVFISGFGDIDQREMYALGAEAFLTKPLPHEHLVAVVERTLAERSALWLTPMDTTPRQSIHIQVQGIGETTSKDSICMGRGGFSGHYSSPISLGKVVFQCHLSSEQREMTGEGYVRWRSRTEERVGIEFAYLDTSCRSWLLEEIAAASPRSFIPR